MKAPATRPLTAGELRKLLKDFPPHTIPRFSLPGGRFYITALSEGTDESLEFATTARAEEPTERVSLTPDNKEKCQ